MARQRYVNGLECHNLLASMVDKQAPLTLTNKADNLWRVYKSHFVSLRGNQLVLAQPLPDQADCQLEPTVGQQLAVSFKKGYNKCLFLTQLIKADRYEVNPGNFIAVINVYTPEHIEKIQRRAYERAEAPQDEPVTVTFWQSQAGPAEGQRWTGQLANLSAGGMAIIVGSDDVLQLPDNEPLSLQFVPLPGQEPICLDGRLRHATQEATTGNTTIGVQFIGLDADEQGRATLRRISRAVAVYLRRQPLGNHKQWMQSP